MEFLQGDGKLVSVLGSTININVHLPSRVRLADGMSVVNEGELHQLVPLLDGGCGVPCRREHGPCIPLNCLGGQLVSS